MKNIDIAPELQQTASLAVPIHKATEYLNEIMGDNSETVSAKWRKMHDERDGDQIELTISDWTGEVHDRFSEVDLRNDRECRYRLIVLWGDLLQVRSHYQLKELKRMMAQPVEV